MTHTAPNTKQFTIKWLTRDPVAIVAIRKRFGIPQYTTINGWSPAEIRPEDLEMFEETRCRGFFSIMDYKWCKNGGTFAFIYRKL